jgi:signal transduction histidine kinase
MNEVVLQIDVTDSGCGISEEEKLKIFTPYFKSSNTVSLAKNFYGNGIGLSICQRIMSHLNGSISVESQIDVGTTFTVRFRAIKSEIQTQTNLTVSESFITHSSFGILRIC